MSSDHRLRAQQQLANLLGLLRAQPDPERVASLIELVDQLDRAISSYHLEGIRFRMYTLGRQLQKPDTGLPDEVRTLYEAVRASLEAAGFHTRSVTS